jgi:alkylation response protein AidB-like acyl-CoA dehydrogenase
LFAIRGSNLAVVASFIFRTYHMDFELDEISRQVAATARDFANQHIRPHVMEWDETQHFPIEIMRAMGRLGLMGVVVPEEYGGSGMGYIEYILVIEEIAKVCGSIGLSLAAHNSLCTGHILAFGSEEQKKTYLAGFLGTN